MTVRSPHNDEQTGDVPPSEKKSIVRFIGIAVAIFFGLVILYMLMSGEPDPEELPINNNPTIEQTE